MTPTEEMNKTLSGPDGLPLPPSELRMGYGNGDAKVYFDCGVRSAASLRRILGAESVSIAPGDALLDWGCASGRVIRFFKPEADQGCTAWGCDVDGPAIAWAKRQLSPPFRFYQSSTVPHIPFPDCAFKVIYGLSVFTHLLEFRDLWLLELGRVLQRGGCLVLTIHDETTWEHFRQGRMPDWVPERLRSQPSLPEECLEIRGPEWSQSYTFFSTKFVKQNWQSNLRIAAMIPKAEGYQTSVVFRKD
jgi:SAM-dependent methyltransferase